MKTLFQSRFCLVLVALLIRLCLELTLAPELYGSIKSVIIDIEGISGIERDNVEMILKVPETLLEEGVIDEAWLERLERQTPRRVRRALEPFGYYSAEVTAKREKLGEDTYQLSVTVQTGKPVLIKDIKIEIRGPGALEPSLSELVARFPLAKGSRLRHDLYEGAKGEIKRKAVNLGYLDASYKEHTVNVSLQDLSARIDLVFDTGFQYHFGTANFTGTPLYPEWFLRRYLEFKTGEIYSQEKLSATHFNFASADRFTIVTVTGKKELAEGNRIPVEINLVPSPTKRVRFGLGFGTDTGPRGLIRYQDFNIWHLGHVFDTELKVSEVFQGLGIRYIMPSSLDIRSYTSLTLTGEREDTKDKIVRYAQLEGAYTRTIAPGMLGTLFTKLQYEDSEAGEEVTRVFMLLPGIRFAHNKYDNLIRPTRGFRYDVELRGTDRALSSNVSFMQILTSGELIMPLPKKFSLMTRMRVGATTDHEPPDDLPISVRFFAGGDNSVRGYKYQSLGPKDLSTGKVVGGRCLLFGSIELERAIGTNWGAAVFYDTGNAFNFWSKMDLAQSFGIGLRYYTIIGPIRLDLARQLDVKRPDLRVHFTVGIGL